MKKFPPDVFVPLCQNILFVLLFACHRKISGKITLRIYFSRKSCVLMDDAKLKTLNYEILNLLGSGTKSDEGLRSVGYLYAMQHGARHIFDAYPETYTSAQIDLEIFKKEMHHQLQSLALNVALGLVSERPYVKRVQNPYAHFGRPDLWTEGFRRNNQRYIHNHIYRICEVRPPSIEKVRCSFYRIVWYVK